MEKDSKIIYDVWKNDPSANKEWRNRNKEWLDNFNEKLKNLEKTAVREAAFRIVHDALYGDPVDWIENIKIEAIDATPTVDAVTVVRCKDCIHNQLPPTSGNANCELWYGMTDLYGYCSRGERIENDRD